MSSEITGVVKKISNITLGRAIRWIINIAIVLLLVLFLVFSWFVLWPTSAIPELEKVDEYVYLDQGWGTEPNSEERLTYYYTPQGTSMAQGAQRAAIRYKWFVNLELPFSDERFASSEHLRKYRFLIDPEPTSQNPHQLPIGFTKHFDKDIGEDVLDITCAACHSGEIHYTKNEKTYAIRIDGGQAMHAFTDPTRGNFAPVMLASLIYTWSNPFKFDRFAKNVLADNYPNGKDRLKDELGLAIDAFLQSGQNNPFRHLYPVEEGFGRTDALGRIGNTVFGDHLTANNYQPGAAPVSYPFIWNIWKFDWVQYNGSVAQPLARNIGEALGVGAIIPMVNDEGNPLPPEQRFNSSVNIKGLDTIEQTLRKLEPPPWPENILGEIDQDKAKQGRQLFDQYCQRCHGPHPASKAQQIATAPLKESPLDQWLIRVIDSKQIGTDPAAAKAFMDRRYDISQTGVTNDDIEKILMPLLLRQLNRNVQYRLAEVIQLRKVKGLSTEVLEQALIKYPEPNAENIPTYPEQSYNNILSALKSTPETSIDFNRTERPEDNYHCDLDCQGQQLVWLLQNGYSFIQKSASSWEVTQLTEGEALNIVGLIIKNKYFNDNQLDYQQQMKLQGFGTIDLPQQINGYKPRPLAGVWATPPFLHNGSVPSVYQLLSPPEDRTPAFYVGHREYDPKHLGYVLKTENDVPQKGFLFDTTIQGNLNTGHGFTADKATWSAFKKDHKNNPLPKGVIGPLLTDNERFSIIEYLKVKTDKYICVKKTDDVCHQGRWN